MEIKVKEFIDEMVDNFHSYYNLDKAFDIIELLKQLGGKVENNFLMPNERVEDKINIIPNNKKSEEFIVVMPNNIPDDVDLGMIRYTIAKHFAHLVLHINFFNDSRRYDIVDTRTLLEYDDIKEETEYFARTLLIGKEKLLKNLFKYERFHRTENFSYYDCASLTRDFNVPAEQMVQRGIELEIWE